MSVKVHHGPPGSYKTSGAVFEDLPIAVRAGRKVVTNIRGLDNAELIVSVLKKHRMLKGDAYKNFTIENIDTSVEAGREKMRAFFHWAEKGAYFILDEINTLFPKEWRPNDLKKYDYPGGLDQAKQDNRPARLYEAMEMHRHFNWDFCLTTPNINKVHDVFKSVAEVSYRHENRATIGLKGSYWEIMHSSDNTGKSKADQLSFRVKRIPKWVFDLYSSTATGEVSDTVAGRNIFKDPKVIFVALLLVSIFGFFGYRVVGLVGKYSHPDEAIEKNHSKPVQSVQVVGGSVPLAVPPGQMVVPPVVKKRFDPVGQLMDKRMWYVGSVGSSQLFEIDNPPSVVSLTARQMAFIGVSVDQVTECMYVLKYEDVKKLVLCRGHHYEERRSALAKARSNLTTGL